MELSFSMHKTVTGGRVFRVFAALLEGLARNRNRVGVGKPGTPPGVRAYCLPGYPGTRVPANSTVNSFQRTEGAARGARFQTCRASTYSKTESYGSLT